MKHLLFLMVISLLLASGCDDRFPFEPTKKDAGSFALAARSTAIRSYPGGGGVFTAFIEPGEDFEGDILLSLRADADLHCTLNRFRLDRDRRVVEIRIAPDDGAATVTRSIELRAWHKDTLRVLPLTVEMYEWSHGAPGDEAPLFARYLEWLHSSHPELDRIDVAPFQRYLTYPQHLVVEHWSYVSAVWDLRLCRHVMVPPYDWSMILLRRMGSRDPILAARLDNGSTQIREIPVSEYPVLYGY